MRVIADTQCPSPATPIQSYIQQAQQAAESCLHQGTAAWTQWAAPPGTKAEPLGSPSKCMPVSPARSKREVGTEVHIYGTVRRGAGSGSSQSKPQGEPCGHRGKLHLEGAGDSRVLLWGLYRASIPEEQQGEL